MIAGGGFGGFYAARALERLLPPQSARVTLVNEANFLLYTPLLPGRRRSRPGSQARRGAAALAAAPHRPGDRPRGGRGPRAARALRSARIDGEHLELAYDQLVVALGSVSRTLPIPGLAEHAIGLKSLSDATAMRNRMLTCLDIAESIEDPSLRAEYLGFLFVGAGYAGVEGLAELQDFAVEAIERYPRCREQGMRWVLVEARGRILQEVPDSLARFAERELRRRGIEVLTDTTLESVGESSATLSGGVRMACRTVVWTAGVKPSPVLARMGLPLDEGGRILRRRDDGRRHARARVAGRVWAIGDCAAVPGPGAKRRHLPADGSARDPPGPPGRPQRGRDARRESPARGSATAPKGVVAELGHSQAVAITFGIRWRGRPAWLISRTYHLLLMPGNGRRLRLLIDWNVALLFGRTRPRRGSSGAPRRWSATESRRAGARFTG